MLLGTTHRHPRASRRHVLARPMRDLPDRRGRLADGLGNLVVQTSNTSRSTKTARSAGPSVWSTVSIAIDTLSASSMSSDTSGLVSSGSGSHSPT